MDLIVQRETLFKPLQAVSCVADKKQTQPILANALLTIKGNQLLLTGTDSEIELIGSVAIESLTALGTTTVSARKLFDICRTLSEGIPLRLSLEKNYLVVRAGESCFMLNTLPYQDFPNIVPGDYPIKFHIKQNHLKNLFAKTYFAMGQQDVRHYLNGTYLEVSHNTIKCVAADGHRLALAIVHDDNIGSVDAKIIIPRKSVLELIRLFGNENDNVEINIGHNRFRMVMPDFTFTSNLINAQYPDYRRLIPKEETEAICDREALKQALTRASILSNEKFRGLCLQLEPGKCRVTANNADQEQAEEDVAINYQGSKLEIGFNAAYLLDVFSAVDSKMIRFAFADPSQGVLIEPTASDEILQVLYVIMPLRL